jgi:hypothetical protein
MLMIYWFEPVLYLDPVSKFPETTERPGYYVDFADNKGDSLKFKVMRNNLPTVLHRRVVRSAANANHLNRRVTFKPDVPEILDKLDNRSSNTSKNRHLKNNDRNINNHLSTRARSMITYPDQNVGVTTRSKIQATCNLCAQGLLFTLHDMFLMRNLMVNSLTNEYKIPVIVLPVFLVPFSNILSPNKQAK